MEERNNCVEMDETGGRCPQPALKTPDGTFFCIKHLGLKDHKIASPPNWVLFQVYGGESMGERLSASGIFKTDPDRDQIDENHLADAQRVGRYAHKYFKFFKKNASGVPIFGEGGRHNVGGITECIAEMNGAGYRWVNVHWYERETKNKKNPRGATLVCGFFKGEIEQSLSLSASDEELVRDYFKGTYQHLHVWNNPPDPEDGIVHAVLLIGHQENNNPKKDLRFVDGLWFVAPVVVIQATEKLSVS